MFFGDAMAELLHELIADAAQRAPEALALRHAGRDTAYAALAARTAAVAGGLLELGLEPRERVAVWLDKCEEAVLAMFGAAAAGCVFVPVNPLLKPAQLAFILRNCGARVLVSSGERLATLAGACAACPALQVAVSVGACAQAPAGVALVAWEALATGAPGQVHRSIETDMAALLYTSGSSGAPKGVVLSHRNLVAGAQSVARYLGNHPGDRILALLPLSFDYGFSQLSTAFASGASVVLANHVPARELGALLAMEAISGLAGVPTLWNQIAAADWRRAPPLRYISNSGGCMPRSTLDTLRRLLPSTQVYLMYGLTEAFRSTYLAPEQVALRPDSIGKAVPNAEVLVLDAQGRRCASGEAGELVHRGPLVALGYWNDPDRTAEHFRPLPPQHGLPLPELALWSGDTVRTDDEGYLYFIGRNDEMIKTSGYRVSPTEVEEVVYATGLVQEAAALGVAHPVLGQAIAVVAVPAAGVAIDSTRLLAACRQKLPPYMLPALVELRPGPLPRNPNGKIDRRLLAGELAHLFAEVTP